MQTLALELTRGPRLGDQLLRTPMVPMQAHGPFHISAKTRVMLEEAIL